MLYELAREIDSLRPLPASAGPRLRSVARALLKTLPKTESLEGTCHPYGFVVVRLGQIDGVGEMRLHLWPDERRSRQKPDWPLHNHPWHVKSFIVAGRLLHAVHTVETLGQGIHQVYQIEYARGASELKKTRETADARLLVREELVSGTVYELDSKLFHEVDSPAGEFAATIVLAGLNSGMAPHVLGTKTGEERYLFVREQVPRDVLNAQIIQALDLMPTA